MKNSETIKKLGLIFPPSPKPLGVYRPTLVVDHFLYVSEIQHFNFSVFENKKKFFN